MNTEFPMWAVFYIWLGGVTLGALLVVATDWHLKARRTLNH